MAIKKNKRSEWQKERALAAQKFMEFLFSMPEPTHEQKIRSKKLTSQILCRKAFEVDKVLNGR